MASPYKLHVHRWIEYKQANVLALSLAQQIAVGTEMMHDLVLWLREGVVDERLPPRPRASQWLELYQDHHRVFLAVTDELPEFMAAATRSGPCSMSLGRSAQLPGRTRRRFSAGCEAWGARV